MSDNKLTQTEASLNPPTADLVTVTINGVELQVPKNENVIESAKRLGVDIPYFCYHPKLSKGDAANCRMCLVEVGMPGPDGNIRFMPKPQTACTLPAAQGMVINTETDKLKKDRRGVLEFLLINHPLDCPICDRGGECPLQNNTLFYGPPTTRYIEEKRHFPKAYPLAENVVFDRERCIHCARCTRFTEDISGDSQLGFLKRGADMEVGTFAKTEYNSKFSGNVIEICPVGALLSRSYRFKARPWDLHTERSICSRCSNGCNIKIDYRLDQLQRVNARHNEAINEEWTCDKGKFGHGYISAPTRLKTPMIKQDGTLVPCDWSTAYGILESRLKAAGSKIGGIGGQRATNEDNYLFQHLFRAILKSNNLDCRTGRYQGPTSQPLYERFGHHGMGNTIADLEKMKAIFVIGANLVDEQPIIFLRVRKAWRFNGAKVVSAISEVPDDTTKVGDFAEVELLYRPGTEVALVNGILSAMLAGNLLTGEAASASFKASLGDWSADRAASECGVSADAITAAARLLATSPMAVIAGKTVADHPYFTDVIGALGNLVVATGNGANLNVPGLECNSQGAMDMGILPDSGPGYTSVTKGMNTQEMLEAAAKGSLDVLWLVGTDLATTYHDPELARRAIEACPFVVVNELELTETAALADLVLPVASVAEKDGTYTSCERRVQAIHQCFEISPTIKPDWLVFAEVAALLSREELPFFSARDIVYEINAQVPLYAKATPEAIGEQGYRWSYSTSATPGMVPVKYTVPVRETAKV
jgi:NADH-quinone oxidoreductase subunit G